MVRGFFYFMNDILQKVADTVTNEPVVVTVDIKPQGWWDRFKFKWKLSSPVKTFSIHQITLGNLIRISKLLTAIDSKIYDPKQLLESNYQAMEKYGNSLAVVVAIALHNKKEMPGKSQIEFVETNFTAIEILSVLTVVIKQMDIKSFMTTIISVKGINILENRLASVITANGNEVSQ